MCRGARRTARMPMTMEEVWLACGTQNNREPARQKESDEKEECKRRAERGSSARPKKALGIGGKRTKVKRTKLRNKESLRAQAFT
ncbi:hypothetical protein EI94DRAFT_687943 [Lactarius quietus]|nr:hypothetical protein EI94DRAFT_687943 [Lactarius quietus]